MSALKLGVLLLFVVYAAEATRMSKEVSLRRYESNLNERYDTYILLDWTNGGDATVDDEQHIVKDIELIAKALIGEYGDVQVGFGTYKVNKDSTVSYKHHFVVTDAASAHSQIGTPDFDFDSGSTSYDNVYEVFHAIADKDGLFRSDDYGSIIWIGDVAAPEIEADKLQAEEKSLKDKDIHVLAIDADHLDDNGKADEVSSDTSGLKINLDEYIKDHEDSSALSSGSLVFLFENKWVDVRLIEKDTKMKPAKSYKNLWGVAFKLFGKTIASAAAKLILGKVATKDNFDTFTNVVVDFFDRDSKMRIGFVV